MIYIDESGIDSFISREYGWSIRGTKVMGEVSGKRFARESFVAGLKGKEVIAPICYQGTMDNVLFNFWLAIFLLPELGKGYVIVMDNASFHKSEKTKELRKNAGSEILFLPPYSPDLNPIENYWAALKARVKRYIKEYSSLAEAVDIAFKHDHLIFK